MRKSVVECVFEHAKKTPDKAAVVVRGAETTYQELADLVGGYSNYLNTKGLSKGDIVVARSSQSLDQVVVYLGVHLAGGVIAPMEKSSSDDNLISVAKQLNAKMILSDKEELVKEYDAIILPRKTVLEAAAEYAGQEKNFVFPKLDDSADILFTTGTTGKSKGVEIQHKALVATAENVVYGCEYKEDTVVVTPGPLNHASAIRKLVTCMVNGNTFYVLNGMLNLKKFFEALEYGKGTIGCCLPPTAIRTIFQSTKEKIGEYADVIDFIESASSPLPEADKERLCALLPRTRLYNLYGLSESGTVCMYDYSKYRGLDGCIGRAMPNAQVLIVDDQKKVIESSKKNMGLLACVGDVNMKGYVNEPELTREVLIDGVVYTNDIGYIDENGFIYIVGRQGDIINVGGLKVAPTEVEAATLGYEGIDDCICIPVDDEISGKALKLLVVCHDPESFDVKGLKKYLISKLERYKVPSYIECVDSVARTWNGKLDRKAYMGVK